MFVTKYFSIVFQFLIFLLPIHAGFNKGSVYVILIYTAHLLSEVP